MTNNEQLTAIKEYAEQIKGFINFKTKELEEAIINGKKTALDKCMEFLIEKVCWIYDINISELKRQRCSSIGAEAQEMIIVIMKKNTPYTNKEIIKFFNKSDRQKVNVAMNKHKEKDIALKHHKFYIENYNSLNDEFINFYQTLTLSQQNILA